MTIPARRLAARLLFVLVASHLIAPPRAAAYIDPLSGSVLVQALVAGALGLLLSIKRVGIAVREILQRVKERFLK